MKKITLLCFLAMGSSVAAWAEVNDKITSLDQLSNDKCYTILPADQNNNRGTWYYNSADPTFLYSTSYCKVNTDPTSQAQQFAFIKSPTTGKYYLYSIKGQRFFAYNTGGVALIEDLKTGGVGNCEAEFVESTHSDKANYPWVVSLNGHHIGLTLYNNTKGVITSYNATNDGGNCISITEAGTFDPATALQEIAEYEKNSIKAKAKQLLDQNVTDKENYLGSFDQQAIQALQAIYDKADATVEELTTAMDAVKASSKKPEATKYYYIQNTMAFDDGQTKAIYENPDGSNIAWNTTAQAPAELWQFEDAGNGKYYIKSANTGKYLELNPGVAFGSLVTEKNSAFTLEQKANSITLGLINYINNDYATLVLQTNNTWGSVAKPEDVSGNYVGTYNEFSDARPTRWNVIEANSVKITISDAKYATIWLPYAVNLNEKVEAYTIGSITDGKATLKKIEGNVIPAKTAAVLYATAGTYEFTIAADNTQDAIKSDLQGTAIRTEVDANVNAYILGNVEGKVGFYQMSDGDRAIAGNKAYLVLPESMSQIRSIIIGGSTTGIEDTVAEGAEAEEYYDLQGRRVMNPTKGIYVTKSGKKVVFNK